MRAESASASTTPPEPKDEMKDLTDFTSSDALGCRIFSRKFWNVKGVAAEPDTPPSAMVPFATTTHRPQQWRGGHGRKF
jgi:hypothetical protein